MNRKWHHAAFALALAGAAMLVPCSAAARQSRPSYTRQQRAQLRREVRQEKRQMHRQQRPARIGRRQLRTARGQYATGSNKKITLRSDYRQAKQTANALQLEKHQQFHLHSHQVLHKQQQHQQKKKKKK